MIILPHELFYSIQFCIYIDYKTPETKHQVQFFNFVIVSEETFCNHIISI